MKTTSFIALLLGAMIAITSTATAATYVAKFDGIFGDGVAFNGDISFDSDLVRDLHNYSTITDFHIMSLDFNVIFGKSTISYADFPDYSEYVMTVANRQSGTGPSLGFDEIGFTLLPLPYYLGSGILGFWVQYPVNTLTEHVTSAPPSSQITYSTAGYGIYYYGKPQAPDNYGGFITNFSITPASAVPETAAWGLMLCGFGAVGVTLRWRRSRNSFHVA